MTRAVSLTVAVMLTLGLATTCPAAVAIVTGTAPLEGDSDEAIQIALDRAVADAVHDAMQLGFRPLRLTDAEIWPDRVVVEVLATNAERDDGDQDAVDLRTGEHLARGNDA